LLVAVDEGRDFIELVSGVLLALVPFLVDIFPPKISPGDTLTDCLNVKAKSIADSFRRCPERVRLQIAFRVS
jgi:hypothetical protein